MTRIAVLADIHGNLVALEAVLADLAGADVDRVVCLGDVAADGPQPHEVIVRLRELGYPIVLGNTDAASFRPVRISPRDDEGRRYADIEAWGTAQLTQEDLAYLRTFPLTLPAPLGDGATLLCFHGSPQSTTDSIEATTPDSVLARLLAGSSAAVFAGGHTHAPFVRRLGQALFLNPGSVGLPYESSAGRLRHPSWAEYGIVELRAGCLGVELRRVAINADLVVLAVRQSGMPHADWLAGAWR